MAPSRPAAPRVGGGGEEDLTRGLAFAQPLEVSRRVLAGRFSPAPPWWVGGAHSSGSGPSVDRCQRPGRGPCGQEWGQPSRQGSFVLGKLSRCLRSFLPSRPPQRQRQRQATVPGGRRPREERGPGRVVVDVASGNLALFIWFSSCWSLRTSQKLLQIALTAHPGQDIAELWGPEPGLCPSLQVVASK